MKKILLSALLVGMLSSSSICSAAWIYVGDYTLGPNFIDSVQTMEDYARIVDNLAPKPYNRQSNYFRLEYDDTGVISRYGEENSLVSLKVDTRLVPMNANNTTALDHYGIIYNTLSIAPKGIFSVTSTEIAVIDFPPKVLSTRVRYHSTNPVLLGVLKRYSAIEAIAQQFSSEFVGTTNY